MARDIRMFDHDRDFEAAHRIWREVGWIDATSEHRDAFAAFVAGGSAEVATLNGAAECLVHRTPGSITYDTTPLPLCAVTAVTTSLIGRKLGLATELTARAVAAGARAGAAVGALGMFEQGYYDRFGFATASYDHNVTFDPQALLVDHIAYRTPVRLDASDADDMANALSKRLRHHGSVVIDAPRIMEAELGFTENPQALGYRDENNELTHFVLGSLKDEHGPYEIGTIAYRSVDQLLELLRLLRELGDQIRSVKLREPAQLSLQHLLHAPFRQHQRSQRSDLASSNVASAWWQLRILDLEPCVAARSWPGALVRFDLELSDPIGDIAKSLAERGSADAWSGLAGRYSITVGESSSVTVGHRGDLPVVRCDIGAFTQLWFGIAPASSLHATGRFEAPAELCSELDAALRLPPTLPGLEF